MNLKKVIVVYKKSAYQVYGLDRKNAGFLKLIDQNHFTVAQLLDSHQTHEHSIQTLKNVLLKMNIKSKFIYRARRYQPKNADLIITIGGDGTFLEASRCVTDTPMLGVNSNPKSSVGMYCGIDVNQVEETLHKIQNQTCLQSQLRRIQIKLNGEELKLRALNDLLICNLNPASSSRFILESETLGKSEYVSSGLWVATPAGSTAAMKSAGGKVMPLEDSSFQYMVRELYKSHLSSPKNENGFISEFQKLKVYSRMRKGSIFIDGAHNKLPFTTGSHLELSIAPEKLNTFAYNIERRNKIYSDV